SNYRRVYSCGSELSGGVSAAGRVDERLANEPAARTSILDAGPISFHNVASTVGICVTPMLYVTFQSVRERSSAIFKARKLHQTERLSAPDSRRPGAVAAPALCVRSRPGARAALRVRPLCNRIVVSNRPHHFINAL